MADLHFGSAAATPAERVAVDAVVAPFGPALLVESAHLVRGGTTRRAERRHLLLPALHALQREAGWISPGGLRHVCEQLQVPPAEAYGVATFYEMLRTTAPATEGPIAHVCDDVACRIDPSRREAAVTALRAAGAAVHDSPCLGQCDRPPGVFVQHRRGSDEVPNDSGPFELPQAGDPGLRLLRRVGVVDPTSLDSYLGQGGMAALGIAREIGGEAVIEAVAQAGLSGRGGAAFPTAAKWRAVRDASGDRRHVVVNFDESEPGTFKDKTLVENDPFAVIEAMCIAALATGAETGWVYVRGEYPRSVERLTSAVDQCRRAGYLGDAFDIEVRRGAGAYICGEETALFNSIEGFRGEPRNKPPYPTTHGLFGQPTAVNNTETLVNVLSILVEGPDAYRSVGTAQSPGTRLFSVSGRVGRPGLYEVPFGTTLGELLDLAGGVTRDLAAVLLGGAAGSFVPADQLGLRLTLEDTRQAGVALGSGAVVVFDTSVDLTDTILRIASFFTAESCGQCVPCRLATVRQHETLVQIAKRGEVTADQRELLGDLSQVLVDASICGLGHTAASAVQSALRLGLVGGGT